METHLYGINWGMSTAKSYPSRKALHKPKRALFLLCRRLPNQLRIPPDRPDSLMSRFSCAVSQKPKRTRLDVERANLFVRIQNELCWFRCISTQQNETCPFRRKLKRPAFQPQPSIQVASA